MSETNHCNSKTYLMPRSHTHGSPRWFHYGSNPTDDPGNDNFYSPIWMHNASTTTYDYGCNTEIYRLIQIATDDAGSYLWLILRQIRECVTWALSSHSEKGQKLAFNTDYFLMQVKTIAFCNTFDLY